MEDGEATSYALNMVQNAALDGRAGDKITKE
jgi:hypothetical protein